MRVSYLCDKKKSKCGGYYSLFKILAFTSHVVYLRIVIDFSRAHISTDLLIIKKKNSTAVETIRKLKHANAQNVHFRGYSNPACKVVVCVYETLLMRLSLCSILSSY